uniref:Progestin and adipoQ receptor family member 6 n=1 Tax=Taeniopygia guttata TaxID=59729 RepID=A0A674G716_TAEGU
MNNETLNVWTHLLPAGYLLWLLVVRLREPGASPGTSPGPSGTLDTSSGPFLAYLGTCALYPLASSAAHALGAMGGHGRHRAFCCDYAALSLYGLGSALAYSAYAFPLEWVGSTFHEFYVPVAVLNSALSTGLACYSRWDPAGIRDRGSAPALGHWEVGKGKEGIFPLGNGEDSMRKMRNNGRSFSFWEVPKGICGILEWFGLGGDLEMIQVCYPRFPGKLWNSLCVPCGIPGVSHVEFPVYPMWNSRCFPCGIPCISHVEFLVYPMWNSLCIPCGIPCVSHVEFLVFPCISHVEFLVYPMWNSRCFPVYPTWNSRCFPGFWRRSGPA